ncbi:Hypothetical protein IALB_2975 [Ignavibacterium album JCM 16511]|uniref:DUF192 domain-containing protein n=1 Tax=Ignavibacterium album (strain DSM 19864 / JCM 16511 / NBRC 101810 / Mat9-16) TaxID=945713 RepID=I0ANX1_IGNAJ|nr:DUF192 domain-containing protein [Ignavibacterium album]AFH50678.1 Hypothetical protein IALB_2975 [Ignavibacterium album JCM 16511]
MVKKQTQNQKQNNKNKKTKVKNLLIGVVILIIAAFLIFNNFIKDSKHEMEYYTFTKEGELIFSDSLGNTKTKIDIEIADDDYQRQLGLMNRKEMNENQGMLFIFPRQDFLSFWMRNTLISLDMIFVDESKTIVTIHKNTRILSDTSYPSSKPARYVVEVIAGFTDKHNIQVGDKIDWMGIKLGQ